MGVDLRNHLFAPGLSPGWILEKTGTFWNIIAEDKMQHARGYHVKTFLIHKLGSIKFTTQNDVD